MTSGLTSVYQTRADFDIFSQGVEGLARGVGNFSPLMLLTWRRCAAPCLRQAIADCWTFLKIIFLNLFRYIFCKGTNKTTMKPLFRYG